MGEVSLAVDTQLNRRVALKRLRAEVSSGTSKIADEAKLLARLNHPNIVQVYELIECDDDCYMAMEFVEGRSLHVLLREERPTHTQKLAWLVDIAEGLCAASAQGIVHRDLKPENVLLTADGTAKISDFGISRLDADSKPDLEALAELSAILLSNEHGSPLQEHMLRTMAQGTLEEARDKLRQVWHEACQQDTAADDAAAPQTVGTRWLWAGIGAAVIVAGFWLALSGNVPDSKRIALSVSAPVDGRSLDERVDSSVRSLLIEALSQQLGGSDDYSLTDIDYSGSEDSSMLASASGSDAVMSASFTCGQSICDVSLAVFDARSSAVAETASFPIPVDAPLESHVIVSSAVADMLGDASDPSQLPQGFSEEGFSSYLQLHAENWYGGREQALIHRDILALLEEAPAFEPLYLLLSHSSLELFDSTGDASYLSSLAVLLDQAERRIGQTATLAQARFKLYLDSGEYDKASASIDTLAALTQDRFQILSMRADLASYEGAFDEAADLYDEAMRLRRTKSLVYNRAANYFFAGQREAAIEAFREVIRVYPDDTDAYGALGLLEMESGDLDAAQGTFEQLVEMWPHGVDIGNLGLVYLLQGDYSGAEAVLEKGLEDGFEDDYLLLNLADTYQLIGKQESADALYSELVQRGKSAPTSVDPMVVAQAQAQLGHHDIAVRLTRNALEQSEMGQVRFAAALVYTLANQQVVALAEAERALQSGIAPIWFTLPWFAPLCDVPGFLEIVDEPRLRSPCT